MDKLTEIEKDTVLSILSSAEHIFRKDEIIGGYSDNGDFVCCLPDKRHVNAIKTAYQKIMML